MKYDFNRRSAGLLVPTFALRHEFDLGIGDVESVRQLVDWATDKGLKILQFLPLNETSGDNSPYNAISSRAICPTTLDLRPETLPGLSHEKYREIVSESGLAEERNETVPYDRVKKVKLALLTEAFADFKDDDDFESFLGEQADWIEDYSLFRLLVEIHGNSSVWDEWPVEHQTFESATLWLQNHKDAHGLTRRMMFFAFVQWIAQRQWAHLKQYANERGLLFMGDIPFGVSRYSADVWAYRSLFDLRWSGGAPPEPYFKDDPFVQKWGQNWGIPLYAWKAHKNSQYKWWKARLSFLGSYVDLVRIDHVLGFFRIFAFPWLPKQNGEYLDMSLEMVRAKVGDVPRFIPGPDHETIWMNINKDHGINVLRELSEAVPALTLVAEDLGFVPDYVRPSLAALEIPGFKIPQFERTEPERLYKDSAAYPPVSVATLATHDHLPMAALWKALVADWKKDPGNDGPRYELYCMLRWLGLDPQEIPEQYTRELHMHLCEKLMASNSSIAILQISDWFATAHRFNVPGPVSNSNWSARLEKSVSAFDRDPDWSSISRDLGALIHKSERVE